MKIWKQLIWPLLWPFLNKTFKYIFSLFERTADEIAKKIPKEIVEPIKNKIIEVTPNQNLSGSEKMKIVKEYAMDLLGDKFHEIGDSILDTFLQVLYQDLKNKNLV